jgi:hypothetical protein
MNQVESSAKPTIKLNMRRERLVSTFNLLYINIYIIYIYKTNYKII